MNPRRSNKRTFVMNNLISQNLSCLSLFYFYSYVQSTGLNEKEKYKFLFDRMHYPQICIS